MKALLELTDVDTFVRHHVRKRYVLLFERQLLHVLMPTLFLADLEARVPASYHGEADPYNRISREIQNIFVSFV